MLRWIIKNSLRFRFLVVAGATGMMVFGVSALRAMPIDVFPEFAPPRVQIQTACLGLSAAEVESLVTIPMEQALNGIADLDVMRSKSAAQLSYVELIFKLGTNQLHARQLVQERMATIQNTLPTWAAPPVIMQPLSATSRVMKIGMSSKTMPLEDMSMTAFWKIRARLLRVPGVANVAMWGERIKAYQVLVDPQKLTKQDVSLDRVMEATSEALDAGILKFTGGGFIGTGGFIDTPNQRLGVRHTLPIVTPQDLAAVVIAERDGKTLRIADVANVVTGSPPLAGDAVAVLEGEDDRFREERQGDEQGHRQRGCGAGLLSVASSSSVHRWSRRPCRPGPRASAAPVGAPVAPPPVLRPLVPGCPCGQVGAFLR